MLKDFIDLLNGLRGVIELKVWTGPDDVYIGFRTGRQRPPHVLLKQINRAAVGFGLNITKIHFGILAD